jgi:cytochrome P450
MLTFWSTLVYYNTYALSKDTRVYQNPDKFEPERFTPKEEGGRGEPFLSGPFGFGRRLVFHADQQFVKY